MHKVFKYRLVMRVNIQSILVNFTPCYGYGCLRKNFILLAYLQKSGARRNALKTSPLMLLVPRMKLARTKIGEFVEIYSGPMPHLVSY